MEERKALSSTARQIIFWLLIIAGALLIYKLVNPGSKNTANIDLTQLDEKIKGAQLKELVVKQYEVVAIDSQSPNVEYHTALTNVNTQNEVLKAARETNPDTKKPFVPKVSDESGTSSYWWPALYYLLPFLLIFGFWI